MALGNKTGKSGNSNTGRRLWVYFLPMLLVAVLLLLVIGVVSLQKLNQSQRDMARSAANTAVSAMAERVSGAMEAKRDLLQVVASSAGMRKTTMLNDSVARAAAARTAQQLLPDVIQLRIVPKGPLPETDSEGPAPLGYAGVDMVTRALGGTFPDVEVHQISSGKPYIAMAVPLKNGNDTAGAMFAAWPLHTITRIIRDTPRFPGELGITQGGNDGYVLASSDPANLTDSVETARPIGGTIWSVAYNVKPESSEADSLLASLVLAGLCALLLGMYLQYRMLSQDLRQDMATLVNIGERMASGEGTISLGAKVSAVHDAILLLADLARNQPVSAAAAENGEQNVAEAEETDSSFADIQVHEIEPAPAPSVQQDVPLNLFRAYDIRGVAGESLNESFAHRLGQAFAARARQQGLSQVCVARDARLSSPALFAALCDGLLTQEIQLLDLGQAPIALLYYAMSTLPDSAAVMLTGSHNPASYNGFKLYLDARAVHGDDLQLLREEINHSQPLSQQLGTVQQRDFITDYTDEICEQVSLSRSFKVVVDGGNGVAGLLACELFEALGCEVVPLFCEPDGSFPNHHPDPSHEENLASLALEVEAQQADLGLAFDGDGDRLGAIDDQGKAVRPEHILMLLAADVLQRHPGTDVVYDVKSSRHLAGYILGQGGRPIMWQAGHTRMKDKMRESGALIGGEFSGHFFVKERWYGTDDAVYVAARLLEVLAAGIGSLSEVLAELPSSPATQELQLELPEGEAETLMQAIEAQASFDDARVIDIDGLRVEFKKGWGLVRASHTVPSLVFRFEADDTQALSEIKTRFRELLKAVRPDLQAPF